MILVQDAKRLVDNESVFILDVRSNDEFLTGHIEGAVLIPVSELERRVDEILKFKDSPILVYCHAGTRSTMACQLLKVKGFTKLYNLQGGITMWNSAGFPVVR